MAGLVLAVGVASGTTGPDRRESALPSPAASGLSVTATTSTTALSSQGPAREGRRPSARPPLVLGWHDDEITTLAIAPDGKTLASGSRDAIVKVWDLETRRERATLRGHSAPILALSFSEDSGSLASADADRNLRVWDVTTGHELLSLNLLGPDHMDDSTGRPAAETDPVQLSQQGPDSIGLDSVDCSGA